MNKNNFIKTFILGLSAFTLLASCSNNIVSDDGSSDVPNTNLNVTHQKYIAEIMYSETNMNSALVFRNLADSTYAQLDINKVLNAGDIVDVTYAEDGEAISYEVEKANLLSIKVEKRSIPGGGKFVFDLLSDDLPRHYYINTQNLNAQYTLEKDFSVKLTTDLPTGTNLYMTYREEDIFKTTADTFIIYPCALYTYDVNAEENLTELEYNFPEIIELNEHKYTFANSLNEENFFARQGAPIGYICNYGDYNFYKRIYEDKRITVIGYVEDNSIYISNQENVIFLLSDRTSPNYLLVRGIYSGPFLLYELTE
jgi:hypothetical protein